MTEKVSTKTKASARKCRCFLFYARAGNRKIPQHVAFKQNLPVAIFSLEMSKEQLINRMFSLESSVDAQKLRTGQLNDQEWERLIESAGVIGKSKLMIDDTPGISIAELRSKCRRMKQENGLSMIIIDYLQLMSGSGGRSSDSRQQEISDRREK